MEQLWFGPSQLSRKRRADRVLERIHTMCSKSPSLVRLHATILIQTVLADDTRVPLMQPAPRGTTHDKLTAKRSLPAAARLLLPRASGFVCHRRATVQMFRNGYLISMFAYKCRNRDADLQLA